MDTISFNPERYQIEITNMMDKFFNDSILSFNPYEKDELFITNFIKENKNVFSDYDGLISVQNYFGTLFNFQSIETNNYNGYDYELMVLANSINNQKFTMNKNTFIYPSRPLLDTKGFGQHLSVNVDVCSSINWSKTYINECKAGNNIFYLYQFDTVNNFNRVSKCHRLIKKDSEFTTDDYREYIIIIQHFLLLHFLCAMRRYTLPTLLFMDGKRIGNASISDEISDFFCNFINKEYKEIFIQKVADLRLIAKEKNVNIEHEKWLIEMYSLYK